MRQVIKIKPPSELSPRVVPRTEERAPALDDTRRGEIHAAVIRWQDLVRAVWELDERKQYTGELPEGLSSQQFWAKVRRAVVQLERSGVAKGRRVGIAVRGRRWWAWGIAAAYEHQ